MAELRPNNYLEVLKKYEDGCTREDCYKCPAFVTSFKYCVFDDKKLWEKWASDRHKEFEEFMRRQK